MGRGWCYSNTPPPPRMLSCRLWSFRSNGTTILTEFRRKKNTFLVSFFKAAQGHRNLHVSIGYLWLLDNDRAYPVPFLRWTAIRSEIAKKFHSCAFNAHNEGFPSAKNTRVMPLPDGQKGFTICACVLIQCYNVMDGRTDRQTDGIGKTISRSSCWRVININICRSIRELRISVSEKSTINN